MKKMFRKVVMKSRIGLFSLVGFLRVVRGGGRSRSNGRIKKLCDSSKGALEREML